MEYFKRRRPIINFYRMLAAALFVLGGFIAFTAYIAQGADAAPSRLGTSQVTLNPGGGLETDGSDGVRFTINADTRYRNAAYDAVKEGQDGVVYRSTYQYCCSGGAPMLNIGGTLYGQAGPADEAANWSSIQIISTSGVASVGERTSNTGNSSATVRYTAIKDGLTYSMDRTVSYLYPNDFVTDSYSFVIPAGNTSEVKFYIGGDTAPGSSDTGYGMMLTEPVRSVISLNPVSQIMFGFREVQGSRVFSGASSQHYNAPFPTVVAGGDIGFVGTASSHDAGLMMQWSLGSTPGTYTGKFEQFVTKQGTNLNAVFAEPRADLDEGVSLNISMVNSLLTSVNGLGYTITLPSGVSFNGAPTTNCGGTLTTNTESIPYTVSLTGVTVGAAANCVVSVPVSAATPGSYAITRANASGLEGELINNIGVSRLNVAVYTLSYSTGGGTSIADTTYEEGQPATIGSTTRPGYTFLGWNTEANGSGTSYAAGSSLVMPEDDVTLYAQWQAIPVDITFDAQGGSAVAAQTDLSPGAETVLPAAPTRDGYRFTGWNTAADGSGTSRTVGSVFTVPTSDTTIYAIWTQEITASYNSQGGSAVNPSKVTLGNNITVKSAPARSGYTFVEWNTAAHGTGTGYNSGDTIPAPTQNILLYAIWEDSDGLSIETENAAPNGGDANNDGMLDSQQANVASFANPVTGKPVSLEVTSAEECFLSDVSVKVSNDLASDSEYTYPLGLLDFAVGCGAEGFTATIKQYFYDAPNSSFVLRKYLDGQYSTVGEATFATQTIDGRQVLVASYDVTDGGPLDADGIVNGTVVDPAGPALTAASAAAEPVVIGAPDTGVKPAQNNIFLLLSGIGAALIGLAVAGMLTVRFDRN